jgi:hypothetical protein
MASLGAAASRRRRRRSTRRRHAAPLRRAALHASSVSRGHGGETPPLLGIILDRLIIAFGLLWVFTRLRLMFKTRERWSRGPQAAPKGFLVGRLVPPERAEDVLFNLLGRYDHWLQKHGAVKARIIFGVQSFGCILSFWAEWLLRRVKLLVLLRKP